MISPLANALTVLKSELVTSVVPNRSVICLGETTINLAIDGSTLAKSNFSFVVLQTFLSHPNELTVKPKENNERTKEGNHALRNKRWRYIRYADGSEELYDHSRDINEWNNVANNNENAKIIKSLRKWLPVKEKEQISNLRR